jgi:hypothetical protein
MARQPDSHPDRFWPSCDDHQPGLSIRPLSQADLAALLAHLDHHQDQDHLLGSGGSEPVVAVRVRASVGQPGASAAAEYQRRRTAELATWARGLPWRVLALVAAGVAAWLVAAPVAPDLATPAGVTVAAGLGWLLRFRTCPGGVLVIDSKQYRGRLRVDCDGMVWHGRHLLVSALRTTLWEADQADEVLGIAEIHVAAIAAIHGASVPWGLLRADGVIIIPARRLPDLLQGLPPVLGPERVAWLADRARLRFRPAA